MKLHLKSLVLEITRKCNMDCKHCMRGKSQNLHMRYEVLETIFRKIKKIDHLVITGGEPSLASHNIQSMISLARENGCEIGNFFCATNAKEYDGAFHIAVNDLYLYCKEPEKCVLSITKDQFHEKRSLKAIRQY